MNGAAVRAADLTQHRPRCTRGQDQDQSQKCATFFHSKPLSVSLVERRGHAEHNSHGNSQGQHQAETGAKRFGSGSMASHLALRLRWELCPSCDDQTGLLLKRRSALKTTNNEAPASAAIAPHSVAMPTNVRIMNTNLTASEKTMFWRMTASVRLE